MARGADGAGRARSRPKADRWRERNPRGCRRRIFPPAWGRAARAAADAASWFDCSAAGAGGYGCNGGGAGGHPKAQTARKERTMPAASHETDKDRYILHLNQALAMEAALVDHLDKEATAVPFPDLQQRLRQHRDETIQHRDRVRAVITELGGTPTPTKATIQPPVTP